MISFQAVLNALVKRPLSNLTTFLSFIKSPGVDGPSQAWHSRIGFLVLGNLALVIGFSAWRTLLDNFSIEEVGFTGREIGILQALREVPGFLAFTTIFVLWFLREQSFAVLSLFAFGIGILLTGFSPTVVGLYVTTVLMSIGFHYYETLNQSLALQWLDKKQAPIILGKILSLRSATDVVTLGLLALAAYLATPYAWLYGLTGGLICLIALYTWLRFPRFPELVPQTKKIVLRKAYSLYYGLTFLDGARRQIFTIFAGFMLVEKFGFSVTEVCLLYMFNAALNTWIAPLVGRLIVRFGERWTLSLEYLGLIFVFTAYAFVEQAWIAALLYLVDHLFFALSLAQKTYFQKIGRPEDMASTASVAFTINHIAAVTIPIPLGLLWLVSPMWVFLFGTGIATLSLLLSQNIPRNPAQGREVNYRLGL